MAFQHPPHGTRSHLTLPTYYMCQVRLLSASNLIAADKSGTSDPCAPPSRPPRHSRRSSLDEAHPSPFLAATRHPSPSLVMHTCQSVLSWPPAAIDVVLRAHGKNKTSKTIKKTLDPTWDEDFEWKVCVEGVDGGCGWKVWIGGVKERCEALYNPPLRTLSST
jgi:hypothetical protein